MSEKRADDANVDILELIDSICDEFRAQWKTGKRPSLESFLSKVPSNATGTLFRSLLPIDSRYRKRAGEDPSAQDYFKRFPQFRRYISDAFHQSVSMDMGATNASPDLKTDEIDATIDSPSANQIGDYELIRELGRGGMGIVYEARHTKSGNRVALKTLPTGADGRQVNADKLYRFRKEFRRLADINHPNLVGMQSLEVEGDRWFFTMDLIAGDDFLSFVRPDAELNEERLRLCLKQLATGILELHRRGIIHRDLKPSNVLVSLEGHVTILDFGLAAQLQRAGDMTQTKSGMFAGTPPYAAPEQMFGERTEASDWYAFGTMLFEALAGERPFHDPDLMALLRKKQEQDPPRLSEREKLPGDLCQLADGLIRREPSSRLMSSEIMNALGLEDETQTSGSTRDSYGSRGSEEADEAEFESIEEEEIFLIGRDGHLTQLEKAKHAFLENRQPQVVWVTGRSGEGKSSLVETFLSPLRRSTEVLVLAGRCYDRESVPFKAVDVLIEALVSFLRLRPNDQVKAWLPRDAHMLAHLFPAMRRVDAFEDKSQIDISNIDDRQIRYRAFFALRDLLTNISLERPILVFIDDLQWGDADSSEVLVDLLSPPNPPTVLLFGSYRSDEFDQSPFLQDWTRRSEGQPSLSGQQLLVEPLNEEQCLEFMARRVNIQPDDLREQAYASFAETKGNPYFLEQLIEGFNSITRQFEPVPLDNLIDRKLRQLPADAVDLLQVVAVAGQAISIEEASRSAGHESPLFSTVTHMRSERLLRLIGSENQQLIDTYHDKIRETVLEGLNRDSRRKIHRAIAETIESDFSVIDANNARVFDLAHHYLEAGDERAFRYQLLAGEAAASAFAMDTASRHLQIAHRIQPEDLDRAEKFELLFLLARALVGSDDLAKSVVTFQKAMKLAVSRVERASCLFALSQTYWKQAEYERCISAFGQALEELREWNPQYGVLKFCFGIASMLQFHLIPRWAVRLFSRRSEEELTLIARIRGWSIYTIGQRDVLHFVVGSARAALLAKIACSESTKVEAWSFYASILSLSGAGWLVKRVARKTAAMNVHESVAGIHQHNVAMISWASGNLPEARRLFESAREKLARTGDFHQIHSIHFLWHIASRQGRPQDILRYVREERKLAIAWNDQMSIAYSFYGQAEGHALAGQSSRASDLVQKAITLCTELKSTMTCVSQAQAAKVALQNSDYRAGADHAWRAIRDIPKLRFLEITVCAFPLYAESILGDSWKKHPAKIRWLSRCKAKCAIAASRLCGVLLPNERPHNYRISGRLAASRRKAKKALRLFDKSIKAAKRIGAESEHARALIDKSTQKYPDADNDRQTGLKHLENLGCVLPDAEIEYLGIDREAHHAKAAEARAQFAEEHDLPSFEPEASEADRKPMGDE